MLKTMLIGRRIVLTGALAGLAGCQPPVAPGATPATAISLGPDNVGYLFLNAPITPQTVGFFTADVTRLLDLNPVEIHIFMNSPGGVIDSAEAMIDFMDRTHAQRRVTFVTHNVAAVASAACYVFLAGQRRYSVARGAFLFHEAGYSASGTLTSQTVQDAAEQLKVYERFFLQQLKARTRLTEGEALSFIRRTVILNAAEARRDGIIDAIAEVSVPKGMSMMTIGVRPITVPRPQTVAPQPQPPG